MKYFYLTGSIIFTVMILVLGFGNVQAQCNFVSFFLADIPPTVTPTFLFFGMSAMGIVTGIFYFGFISSLMKESAESEDDGTDW